MRAQSILVAIVIGLAATAAHGAGTFPPATLPGLPTTLTGSPGATPVVEAQSRYRRAVLDADPGAGVLALAVRFPVGSAQDPRGEEGTAFFLGRVLETVGNRALASYGATLRVEVGAEEFVATILSVPDRWREAIGTVENLLYEATLSESEADFVRADMLAILTFEAGAPVRAFELERSSFILGQLDPAARPPHGTRTSIGAITSAQLESFRAANIRAEQGVVAAIGPISALELESQLGTEVQVLAASPVPEVSEPAVPDLVSAPATAPSVGAAPVTDALLPDPVLRLDRSEPPLELPMEPIGPPAWSAGERVIVDRDLTSTWISVALPFPRGTPPLLLEFLGHLIRESLTPSPPDPALYEASAVTTEVRDSPVLVVTASVDPRATTRWEERLRSAVLEVAEEPPRGAFFELARRRFRTDRVLALAVPENRATWLARQIALPEDLRGGDPRRDVWRIERSAVGNLAAAAGPARVILFGPQSMMDP